MPLCVPLCVTVRSAERYGAFRIDCVAVRSAVCFAVRSAVRYGSLRSALRCIRQGVTVRSAVPFEIV